MDKHIEMLGSIRTKEEFLQFMQLYTDATQDASVKQYLEALTAWAADMEGYYLNAQKPVPENINWDFIATLLYAVSIYE